MRFRFSLCWEAAKAQASLCMRGSRGGGGVGGQGSGLSLKNYKNIGFLSNTGSNSIKNHKATKPALKIGPTSACQRNAISMVFRWRAYDGLL